MKTFQWGAVGLWLAFALAWLFIPDAAREPISTALEKDTRRVAAKCNDVMVNTFGDDPDINLAAVPMEAFCACVTAELFAQNGQGDFFVNDIDAFLRSPQASQFFLLEPVIDPCLKEFLAVPA